MERMDRGGEPVKPDAMDLETFSLQVNTLAAMWQ